MECIQRNSKKWRYIRVSKLAVTKNAFYQQFIYGIYQKKCQKMAVISAHSKILHQVKNNVDPLKKISGFSFNNIVGFDIYNIF
jgi:hypothetical protein